MIVNQNHWRDKTFDFTEADQWTKATIHSIDHRSKIPT